MLGICRYTSLNSYAITINSAFNANIEKTAESRRKLKHSPQRAGSAAPRWPRVDRSGPRGPRFNSGAPRFFAVPAQCVAREPDRCKQLDRASFDETQRVIAMNSVQRSVSPVRRKSAPVRQNAKHARAHKDSAVQAWVAHRVTHLNGRAIVAQGAGVSPAGSSSSSTTSAGSSSLARPLEINSRAVGTSAKMMPPRTRDTPPNRKGAVARSLIVALIIAKARSVRRVAAQQPSRCDSPLRPQL